MTQGYKMMVLMRQHVDSNFFHRQYDSPIKQKPLQHIQEQDAEIEHLNKCLTWSNSPLLKLCCKNDAYQT